MGLILIALFPSGVFGKQEVPQDESILIQQIAQMVEHSIRADALDDHRP